MKAQNTKKMQSNHSQQTKGNSSLDSSAIISSSERKNDRDKFAGTSYNKDYMKYRILVHILFGILMLIGFVIALLGANDLNLKLVLFGILFGIFALILCGGLQILIAIKCHKRQQK